MVSATEATSAVISLIPVTATVAVARFAMKAFGTPLKKAKGKAKSLWFD